MCVQAEAEEEGGNITAKFRHNRFQISPFTAHRREIRHLAVYNVSITIDCKSLCKTRRILNIVLCNTGKGTLATDLLASSAPVLKSFKILKPRDNNGANAQEL